MNNIFFSLLIIFSFSHLSFASTACYQHVAKNKKPESHYKQQEVVDFLFANRVLPEKLIQQIQDRVSLYSLRGEDMGNSILIHVFAALGPQASRQRDVLIEKFLKPIFDYYQKEFEDFSLKIPPGVTHRIPNQFGLSKLGFAADNYGFIHWKQDSSLKFIQLMKAEFSKKLGFDLVRANRLLVQMSLIHSVLSGQQKMLLSEVKRASDDYLFAESNGHVFIPTIGEWDLPNIVAQWHLRATVNMLPQQLSQKTIVHGGDGLSALEGITHDHDHVVRWRMGVVADSAGLKRNSTSQFSALLSQERKLVHAFDQALIAHKKNPNSQIDQETLTYILFFFVHQPEPLTLFLKNPSEYKNLSKASELAQMMQKFYEENQNFYPMISANKEAFEMTSSYWIQLLANQMSDVKGT
jgi:hypothetical protein